MTESDHGPLVGTIPNNKVAQSFMLAVRQAARESGVRVWYIMSEE